jgi:hypothetical protein
MCLREWQDRGPSERTLLLSQHRESTGNLHNFMMAPCIWVQEMYMPIYGEYVCGDFEGLFVSVAGQGPI